MNVIRQDDAGIWSGGNLVAELGGLVEGDISCALTTSCPVLITASSEIAIAIGSHIHFRRSGQSGSLRLVDCGQPVPVEEFENTLDSRAPGTVFLHDVDRLGGALQRRLYVVVATSYVRVIASTHVDLFAAVARGEFEEGLFYRLNQLHICTTRRTGSTAVRK